MTTTVWDRVKPWAVSCLQGSQNGVGLVSAEVGEPFKSCTIIYDTEQSDVHIVSDDTYSFSQSTLLALKSFLRLELGLSGQQNILENSTTQANMEIEEPLEEEDRLAEVELELELERLAVDDPDVVALTQASEPSDSDDDGSDIRPGDFGDGWKGLSKHSRKRQVLDCVLIPSRQSKRPRHGTQADFYPTQTSFLESDSDVEAELDEEMNTVSCSDSDDSGTHQLGAKAVHPSLSTGSTAINGGLSQEPTLQPAGPQAIGCRKRIRPSKSATTSKVTDSDSGTSEDAFAFVLDDEDCKTIEKPSAMSTGVNTDVYMKLTFNIDLAKVPGRTGHKLQTVQTGKTARQIREPMIKQDVDKTPISNCLIEDPDLSRINCAYMVDYDIVVCRNLHQGRACGYGIPLASLLSHCWGPRKGKQLGTGCNRVPHWIELCKKRDTYKGRSLYTLTQKRFIQRILARHPNIVVALAEMRDLCMREDQFGPIAHIGTPIQGFTCNHCDFATYDPGKDTFEPAAMREHWQEHRRRSPEQHTQILRGQDLRHSNEFRRCLVQSFDRDRNNALWLPVLPGPGSTLVGQVGQDGPRKSFGQLLGSGQRQSKPSIAISTLDRKNVLPFFSQNGAFDLIISLDPSKIMKLIDLPARHERALRKLKSAVVERFQKICNEIPSVSDQLRELLVSPKRGERGMIDRFNCPARSSTINSYALEEVRLLCFILRCLQQDKFSMGGSESPVPSEGGLRIGLTTQQFECFQALLQALTPESQLSPLELESLIHEALCSTYMPSNSFEMFENIFRNPSTIFTVLRSTRPQGGFANPKAITVHYARIQFGIRLAIMATIQERYRALQDDNQGNASNTETLYVDFMQHIQSMVTRWASEEHISPLAFVRGCMRAMSRVARQAPSGQTVMWNTNATKLTVQNHTVDISQYVDRVQHSLSSLARKVDAEILFGIEFPSGSFDLSDHTIETNDMDTPGFSLFAFDIHSNSYDPDNHPASHFLQRLCEQGVLCARQGDGIIWDTNALNRWLLTVSEVWSEAMTLVHLLGLPGRGTEVTSWQHANSPTGPRHLFLSKRLRTLITHSTYNKTTSITGKHKYILRVVPFALSIVITKLLRIVRPVETLAFTSQAVGDKYEAELQTVYATYMFVSHGKVWDSNVLSACLQNWFMRELKVPFGLHLHRHFAQALQRMFLSYEKDNELAETANEVLGHSGQVAGLNYAREAQDLHLDTSKRRMMEQVGSDWITKVHKLEISADKVEGF